MPAALEKHLSEQPCHFPSQMSDERRSIWVWDLPFPIQIDGRRYRCRTCAANGASMRYYVITVSDLQAAFPDLLTWRDRRHGTVFFTKKFLLYLVQVFYRRLNVRATKRAIVEQIGASALALGCMTRLRTLCTAIPSNVSLRKILLNALEGYTSSAVKRLRQHINLYAGTLLRHDGNYDIPERVAEFSGGVRRRPHGCLVGLSRRGWQLACSARAIAERSSSRPSSCLRRRGGFFEGRPPSGWYGFAAIVPDCARN